MKVRARVIVTGRVQGVSFRHHTARTASQHGVTGWVRNLPDGSVEACFEGDEAEVRGMVQWCRKGPALAEVEDVIEENEEYTGEYSGFDIRH